MAPEKSDFFYPPQKLISVHVIMIEFLAKLTVKLPAISSETLQSFFGVGGMCIGCRFKRFLKLQPSLIQLTRGYLSEAWKKVQYLNERQSQYILNGK